MQQKEVLIIIGVVLIGVFLFTQRTSLGATGRLAQTQTLPGWYFSDNAQEICEAQGCCKEDLLGGVMFVPVFAGVAFCSCQPGCGDFYYASETGRDPRGKWQSLKPFFSRYTMSWEQFAGEMPQGTKFNTPYVPAP